MSRLHNALVSNYAEHYARVNSSVDPAAAPRKSIRALELMYGGLLSPLESGARVLDLGCGTGIFLKWLSGWDKTVPVGVDGSPTQVEAARSYLPGVEIACEDGLAYLRRNEGTFAGIFCFDVLEHIPGEDLLLDWVRAARSALRPGGFFVCRVPNAANLTAAHARYMDLTHQRLFTEESMVQLLRAGGFAEPRVTAMMPAHVTGRIRFKMEEWLHRAVYRVCGRGGVGVFTYNLAAISFRD
jgi:SAM-dependent methyltransferase